MSESIVMAAKTIESVTDAVEAASKPAKALYAVGKDATVNNLETLETPKPASRRRPARKT